MISLTCFSLGVLPICLNIALIIFSLIGGFLASSFLKYHLLMKNPAIAPARSAPTPIRITCQTSIVGPPYYALPSYSGVSVSVLTKITSPDSMNNGTRTLKPVSKTASFIALLTVSPRTAGSHSTICKATLAGKLIPRISSS